MTEDYRRLCRSRADAHQAVKDVYALAQISLAGEEPRPVWISCIEDDDPVSAKQRRFFHGPVLEQIAEQVRVGGQRYTRDIWKLFFKDLFLEVRPRYVMVKLPGQKRATPRRHRWATEELGVKRYSQFIDEVLAHASTEFGVVFHFLIDEREAVRYRPPQRKKQEQDDVAHA